MKNNILNEFEILLNNEAKRIIEIMTKSSLNISYYDIEFSKFINQNIKKEFVYYRVDIEIRIFNLIFNNDKIKNHEGELSEKYLKKYILWCKKDIKYKNHLIGANKLATIIIDLYEKKEETNISLIKLVADNMNILFPEHNDSLDARAIILYLEDEK